MPHGELLWCPTLFYISDVHNVKTAADAAKAIEPLVHTFANAFTAMFYTIIK
jgi:hypothetical protein